MNAFQVYPADSPKPEVKIPLEGRVRGGSTKRVELHNLLKSQRI